MLVLYWMCGELLAEVEVEKVGEAVAGASHLQIYQVSRQLNGLVVKHWGVVRVPFVDNLIVVTNLLYPVVKVALGELLNLALLPSVELGCNLVVALALVNQLWHLVIHAVELILLTLEGTRPEAARTWNV